MWNRSVLVRSARARAQPKRKTVYILCSIPLDIRIDELVTWKQLTGDRRLSDALAECDVRKWDAMPLAAKAMARLLPELWTSEKAAERWLDKNPLGPNIDIIRVWGVLAEYRGGARHRRWSKTLVRHGADPRMALSAVLGLPAEDIQVKEGTGSGSPTKASTASTTVSNSPSPDAAVAAE